MRITRQIVVFDTSDIDRESAFWADLMGGEVRGDEDAWRTVDVDGEPRLGFQLAPGHERPAWPDGPQQQLHLDLYVDDIREAHEHAIAVGATLLREAADLDAADGFQVYADPSGHPFCLCWELT
ncbi:VOC family protein [Leifsonia soli]|uniref:Putative enzyme related to lactoylglutathione lyase n=1 Tax=Leifsonia soli TaxID=582665 RepID=A0A852T3V9_9MICO|nr:VOC family protein [Leifsonia soli]NYD75210.1 putative enzyme related to lactoylglutathione lyase [Leifsonia soli]